MNLLLCGKAGTGKTTAAAFLEEVGYTEFAIGSVIREIAFTLEHGPASKEFYQVIAYKLFNNPAPSDFYDEIDQVANYLKKIDSSRKVEFRPALQKLGDVIRKVDQDAFLRVVANKAKEVNGPVVISDGRLAREVEFLEKYNFKAYEIVTEDKIRIKRLEKRDPGFKLESLNHPTEQEVFTCPKIMNNDSLKEFKEKILMIGGELGEASSY